MKNASNELCQGPRLLLAFTFGEGKSCLPFKLITKLSVCVPHGFVNVKAMMSSGDFQFELTCGQCMWNQISEGRKQTFSEHLLVARSFI